MKNIHYCRYRMHMVVLLIAAGMMMLVTGCGQEETVSVDAQMQTGETSGTLESDSVSGSVSEDSVVLTNTEDNNIVSAGTVDNNTIQQLEMDDETRQQLMTELLEENGMDTSVMEPGRPTGGCTFDVPEGFEESQDMDDLYVTARYPLDASMIYYEVVDGDVSLQLMTEEMFKEQAEESLSQVYGEDLEVYIDSYESAKIDGYPTFRILCHYEAEGIRITQLEYVINADKTYVVTYSQTSDYDWMEAFEASAATIHVK